MSAQRRSLRHGLTSSARRLYFGTRRLLDIYVIGTRVHECSWRWRHLFAPHVAHEHWQSVDHPHRPLLEERILVNGAPASLLEIGCNSGPNLYRLARALPDAMFYGVDINASSISYGRRRFQELGITNVELSVAAGDRLDAFGDKSVDVVLTDAMLMYVGPDKIHAVIADIVRIARTRVLLNEWQIPDEARAEPARHREHFGHWIHDFRALFEIYVPSDQIQVYPIGSGVWGDSGWDQFGAIIDVRLTAPRAG